MRFSSDLFVAPLLAAASANAFQAANTTQTDCLAAEGLENLSEKGISSGACTLKNAAVRREW
jgi:hypothetical protein